MEQNKKKGFFKKGLSHIFYFYRSTRIFRLLLVVISIYIVFFDTNSIIVRFINARQITRLKSEISFYQNEIEQSKKRVKELNSNRENLEKFAREQFLMKKKNEDIFLVDPQ